MADFKDVEVRIRGSRQDDPAYRCVEAQVDHSGRFEGESRFEPDTLDADDPLAYGRALGTQLATPNLVRALDYAGLTRGEPIRFRLSLDEASDLHWVRWERMSLCIGGTEFRLATRDGVAFSRYIGLAQPDGDPPDAPVFRLLLAIANPCDLADKAIDVEPEIESFLETFEQGPADRRLKVAILPGRTGISAALAKRVAELGWDVLSGPTELQHVGEILAAGYHALHVVAHGDFDPQGGPAQEGIGRLLLENADGGKNWVQDRELESWLGPQLQLVLFHACRGAANPGQGKPPLVGLAPRLVKMGLPAAVAMQEDLVAEDGRRFFRAFYRTLLDEGLVDVAVNRGRRQLVAADAASDAWSNPVLFTRLRGGRLWRADPLRRSVDDALAALPVDAAPPQPIDAIEHTRGAADYNPPRAAAGPRYGLWERCRQIASDANTFLVLTGPSGSLRLPQLRTLFRYFAQQFLENKTSAVPFLVTLDDLRADDGAASPLIRRILRGEMTTADEARTTGRRFLFLVDGEEAVGEAAREAAVTALARLKALAGSSVVLLADQTLIPIVAQNFQQPVLLVAQPLEWPRVAAYLDAFDTDWARALRDGIPNRGCADLAAHPRFLQHMLDLASRGVAVPSRGEMLDRITATYLARAKHVPSRVVEDAARRVAWAIQQGDGSPVPEADLYQLLTDARGERDFPLSDLYHALLDDCRLLVAAGREDVRFAYPTLQAYFAARYLANAPESSRLIDDIAATFGRLSRLRRWEQVFIALTGMVRPWSVLRAIVKGSSLMEGQQLFLAARCYQEAVAEHPGRDRMAMAPVVEQMVDTLVWRSGWDPDRPYTDRRMALDSLIAVVAANARARSARPEGDVPIGDPTATPAWEPQVVAHLLSLACDPVMRAAGRRREKYDWSGIRRAAALGLLRLNEQASAYIGTTRRDLLEPQGAWWRLRDDADAMKKLLLLDNARVSPVAAFALAQTGRADERKTLLEAYEFVRDPEVRWAIAVSFENLDAERIHGEIIGPWMTTREEPEALGNLRRAHVCYLVQKACFAPQDLRRQMEEWLRSGVPDIQGRVLRAFSKLQDREVEDWVRTLCEQILRGAVKDVEASRMKAISLDDPSLRRAAIETLRDIGDARSLGVVRSTLNARRDTAEMRQLRFLVAEEMYWRITGGRDPA